MSSQILLSLNRLYIIHQEESMLLALCNEARTVFTAAGSSSLQLLAVNSPVAVVSPPDESP